MTHGASFLVNKSNFDFYEIHVQMVNIEIKLN